MAWNERDYWEARAGLVSDDNKNEATRYGSDYRKNEEQRSRRRPEPGAPERTRTDRAHASEGRGSLAGLPFWVLLGMLLLAGVAAVATYRASNGSDFMAVAAVIATLFFARALARGFIVGRIFISGVLALLWGAAVHVAVAGSATASAAPLLATAVTLVAFVLHVRSLRRIA